MTLKKFRAIQLSLVVVLAAVVGWSVVRGNFIVPIIATAAALALLSVLQKQVKEIIADERDYETSGKAARLTISVFSWLAIFAVFAFLAFRDFGQDFEIIAVTMAYAVCLLLILYSLFFRYYNKVAFLEKKLVYILVGILLILVVFVAGIRLLSGEDSWICQDGQWVKHGQPTEAAPTVECQR